MIHPSHQPAARRALIYSGLLLLPVLLLAWLPEPPAILGEALYLPLHIVLETLSIIVAVLGFAVVWCTRREQLPRNMVLLATALLGVALLDFSHMLTYQGMPDLIIAGSAQESIYYWLVAQSLGALALLAVACRSWKPTAVRLRARIRLALVLLLVAVAHGLYVGFPQLVPTLYVPGQGLTPFKIAFEYGLIGVHLLTAAVLWWRMRQPRHFNASGLLLATCILAESEFFFTLYTDVTDTHILLGHVYKVLAYAVLYRTVFVETVLRPYELLRQSRRQLQATLDALPDHLFEMDGEGRYLEVHTGRTVELSAPIAQLKGRRVQDVLPARDAGIVMAALQQAREEGVSRGKIITLPVMQGRQSAFELSVARQQARPGQEERFLVISRDITERLHSEQALKALSLAVSQSPVSVLVTDPQGRITFVNEAFTRISGYPAEEVLGRNPRILQSGNTPAATYRAMWSQLTQGKPWQGELHNRTRDGRELVETVLIYPVRDAAGEVTHYLAHKEDITEKKRAAERIQQLSQYDQLTGLPNRSLLQEHYQYAIARDRHLAVLWIDLDHFKDVNDSLGHNVGDLLLLDVTRRLRASLMGQDVLARYSGDDFVALLPGTRQDDAARLAQVLLDALSLPAQLGGQDIFVTASIGIALYPDDAQALPTLLKHAETAMYRAKEDGRNGYRFFAPAMQERTMRTLALGNALKQAQQRGELSLVYQPQVALDDGRVVGAEALLRWHSPQWGPIPTAEFIAIAEANGLIIPIGEWVLGTALGQLRQWLDQGLPAITMGVNLSAVQFNQPGLSRRVGEWLAQTGVPPECLDLELTEAVAMKDPDAAVVRLEELREQRIFLSIDDFGTGYSSLSHLKRFSIHTLKIDQSFVRDIHVDPDDQAIVIAIIRMARSLGLGTVAEGVETAAQAALLRDQGCQVAQGHYFGRPMPADEFERYLRARLEDGPARFEVAPAVDRGVRARATGS